MRRTLNLYFYQLILITLLTNCNSDVALNNHHTNEHKHVKQNVVHNCDSIVESRLIINSNTYSYSILNGQPYMITNWFRKDTIIPPNNYYSSLEIIDLNKDGYDDIRVYAFSNTSNQCDTYLFNSLDSTFTLLKGTMLDLVKLGDTEFYHYYAANGCADDDWESELGIIKDFEFQPVASIQGYGCEAKGSNRNIIIRKWSRDQQKWNILETLNFESNINYKHDKWSFINAYWEKNYKKFKYVYNIN